MPTVSVSTLASSFPHKAGMTEQGVFFYEIVFRYFTPEILSFKIRIFDALKLIRLVGLSLSFNF